MNERKFDSKKDLAIRPDAVGLTYPRAPRSCEVFDGVAVLNICGPLEHKSSFWFESYESLLSRFEGAICDDEIGAVILNIDSPGGEVSGLQETVRKMRAIREESGKTVIAYCNEEAYSAAYALACAAEEIYLPESGGCGSVGVLAQVCDRTAAMQAAGIRIEVIRSGAQKAEGHPDIPLTDDTIARVQERVDGLANQFFTLVSEARPVSTKKLASFQGGLLYGAGAVKAGLADGVLSFDEVLDAMRQEAFDNLAARGISSATLDAVRQNGLSDQEQETGDYMFAALEKKVASAQAAVIAAKTPAEKKEAAAALVSATTALIEAKVKKSYKKKTVTTEEEAESDDGDAGEQAEEEEEAAAEGADEAAKPPPSDDDADEGDDDEEEESAKGTKAADAHSVLKGAIAALTGKKNVSEQLGVLAAMKAIVDDNARTTAIVERMVKDKKKSTVDTMLSAATRAGKITPAEADQLRPQGMKDAKWLKGYLSVKSPLTAPRMAPLAAPAGASAETSGANPHGLTDEEMKMCTNGGASPEQFAAHKAKNAQTFAKVN